VLAVILAKADQQLTAAIGILGSVVGYLFGALIKEYNAEKKPGKVLTPLREDYLIEVQKEMSERPILR
jgi:hypothetical protein